MAIEGARVVVGTGAVELSSATDHAGQSVRILECDVDLFLGGTNAVTTGTGAKLAAGNSYSADLQPGEHLFGVAAGPGTAHVMRQGV